MSRYTVEAFCSGWPTGRPRTLGFEAEPMGWLSNTQTTRPSYPSVINTRSLLEFVQSHCELVGGS